MSLAEPPPRRATSRADLVDRFLAVQPRLRRRFAHALPGDLRDQVGAVTPQQMHALHAISRHGGVTMGTLASCLPSASPSGATQIADRLVRLGLVERRGDPEDRRLVRLSLSPRARTMVAGLEAGWRRGIAEALEGLSDAECATLVSLLERVAGPAPDDGGPR